MPTDVKMILGSDNIYDLGIDPITGDFITEDSFDTALLYSFFGERRATESEVGISKNRGGWIGNENQEYENGSKVWLFYQARLTRENLNRLNAEAFNGVKWLLDDDLVKDLNTTTGFQNGSAGVFINILRFDSLVDKKFFALWENTGN